MLLRPLPDAEVVRNHVICWHFWHYGLADPGKVPPLPVSHNSFKKRPMKSDTTHQFRLGPICSQDELEELWAIDNAAYGAASYHLREISRLVAHQQQEMIRVVRDGSKTAADAGSSGYIAQTLRGY